MARGMAGGNMGNMMKQIQKLQKDMAAAQEAIENQSFEATAGGGAIKVTVSGKRVLQAVELKPEIVDPDDIEMLQDLIISATNEALKQAEETMSSTMSRFAGSMNIPGLF